MLSVPPPIINPSMFGDPLQPARYQFILNTIIKPDMEVLVMHDLQFRDTAIGDTFRQIFPQYNGQFYNAILPLIYTFIDKYQPANPQKYAILNSIAIDYKTDQEMTKQLHKSAKNFWHQDHTLYTQLFCRHFEYLNTFVDPNDQRTLGRKDAVIRLIMNTTIKLALQSKEQPLLKSSTLLKGVALHDTLETFRPGLNLKALRKRLAEIKKPLKKRVGGREFATSLREQLNHSEHPASNAHAPISNLLPERSNQNMVPVQSDVTRNSLNGQHHDVDAHNAPLENANNAYETPPVALLEWNVDDQIMQRGIAVEMKAIQRNNHTNLRDDPPMVVQPSLQEHNAPFQPGPLPAAPAPVPFDFYRNSTWDNTAQYHPMQYNEHINYHAPPPIESFHHPIAMRYGDYNAPQVGDMMRRYGNVHDGNHMGFVQQHRFSPYDMPSPMLYGGGAHAEPFNQYF